MVELVPRRKLFESLGAGLWDCKVFHFGEGDGNGGRLDCFRDIRGGRPGEEEEEEADDDEDATERHNALHGQSGSHHDLFIVLVDFEEAQRLLSIRKSTWLSYRFSRRFLAS